MKPTTHPPKSLQCKDFKSVGNYWTIPNYNHYKGPSIIFIIYAYDNFYHKRDRGLKNDDKYHNFLRHKSVENTRKRNTKVTKWSNLITNICAVVCGTAGKNDDCYHKGRGGGVRDRSKMIALIAMESSYTVLNTSESGLGMLP